MNRDGMSPGRGTRVMVAEKSKSKKNKKSDRENTPKKPRRRGGFSFTTVIKPEDSRQGWMQIETNQIVVNLGHAVARGMEKSKEAKQYHLCRIISNELLKLAARSGRYTVEKALEISDKIFSLIINESNSSKQNIWNFNNKQIPKSNSDDKFTSKEERDPFPVIDSENGD